MNSAARREAGIAELVQELHAYGDAELADKLATCQRLRLEHRQAVRRGEGVGWPARCRSVACSACWRGLRRGWEARTRQRFEAASGAETSMVTLLLSRCARLDQVDDVIGRTRAALRNLRVRRGWSITADGVFEVDALHPADVARLYSGRREALADLPVCGTPRRVEWVPSLHVVLHHPGVTRAELQAALVGLWPGRNRVDVQPTHDPDSAEADAAAIVGYALKHRCVSEVGPASIPWPMEWQAEYWSWLCNKRRGMEPLRLRSRPRRIGPSDPPTPDHSGSVLYGRDERFSWVSPPPI